MPFVDSYPFETIIAQSEKDSKPVGRYKGSSKYKDEGVEVYYTINDCLYSTREMQYGFRKKKYPIKEYTMKTETYNREEHLLSLSLYNQERMDMQQQDLFG